MHGALLHVQGIRNNEICLIISFIKDFVIFDEVLNKLQKRTVENIEHCQNCFCKYHCAGDCLTRSTVGITLDVITDNTRCIINQSLTLDKTVEQLEE